VPANRIIPSLLLRDGRLVKGVRFGEHRDAGAPATTCRAHSAQGADEILLLDIDASRQGRPPDFSALAVVAKEIQIPLTFGGGLTSIDLIHQAIEGGADKVCLTTAALDKPDLIDLAAHRFGAQAVVVGVDVLRDGTQAGLYDHRRRTTLTACGLDQWVDEVVARGAGEVRLCAVDNEGTREGLDIELYHRVRSRINVPIILEGGAGDLPQVVAAMKAGVDSIGLGTLLVFSDNNLVKIRRFLGAAHLKVRP
jgi:cyclase